MDVSTIAILLILLLILLLALGTPISFGLGFLGLAGIVCFLDLGNLYQIAEIAATTGTNLFMITLPLFILMAEIVSFSGIGDDIYTAAHDWLSWLPGGLAISSIVTCTGFAAISGSSPATAATIGLVSIPEMIKRGYNRRLAVGSIAVGGTLGILIPPSITMIIYGFITEVSIGKLFIAGIIPGLILAFILCLSIALAVKARPGLAPATKGVSWSKRFSSLKRVWAFLFLAISIIGSIYAGIATPTESAAIGATLSLGIAIIYRRLTVNAMHEALKRTVAVTSMIMFLVIGGNVLAFLLSSLGIPQFVTEGIISLNISKWSVMIIINIILLLMGCLLDPMAIMVISLPILFPIVTQLGFDPVWFGIVVTINVEMGMITPPVGLNLFILKGSVPNITMKDIVGGAAPFLFLLVIGLMIIMFFPSLATWLPGRMGF
ncbi:MAG: TRAP transporter large permease [Deltaproteobacteria bacterium]|nr:TRAP transporter large permease [Deltaproteobacteria bacterium]MBW2136359.1 TRAP transporter large permease [Deltaproteobacteria bacterium]